ncbi:hypothetical protein FGO68_gene14959 [Halteria grandinella]|uniref:B box-type domain-containing protein n=1 Tax=Halteria grandinella TaxID=5974 RepID=A0A8J8NUY0_HALGN|nr:hypothetical protein FGO68_gene14959 [Halteria grandinella]
MRGANTESQIDGHIRQVNEGNFFERVRMETRKRQNPAMQNCFTEQTVPPQIFQQTSDFFGTTTKSKHMRTKPQLGGGESEAVISCNISGQTVTLFCETCCQLLCQSCATLHGSHDIRLCDISRYLSEKAALSKDLAAMKQQCEQQLSSQWINLDTNSRQLKQQSIEQIKTHLFNHQKQALSTLERQLTSTFNPSILTSSINQAQFTHQQRGTYHDQRNQFSREQAVTYDRVVKFQEDLMLRKIQTYKEKLFSQMKKLNDQTIQLFSTGEQRQGEGVDASVLDYNSEFIVIHDTRLPECSYLCQAHQEYLSIFNSGVMHVNSRSKRVVKFLVIDPQKLILDDLKESFVKRDYLSTFQGMLLIDTHQNTQGVLRLVIYQLDLHFQITSRFILTDEALCREHFTPVLSDTSIYLIGGKSPYSQCLEILHTNLLTLHTFDYLSTKDGLVSQLTHQREKPIAKIFANMLFITGGTNSEYKIFIPYVEIIELTSAQRLAYIQLEQCFGVPLSLDYSRFCMHVCEEKLHIYHCATVAQGKLRLEYIQVDLQHGQQRVSQQQEVCSITSLPATIVDGVISCVSAIESGQFDFTSYDAKSFKLLI